ncbi:rhomboid family intramembrane serine protease [Marvinbryantia formatexigens DSM 14469]|nr:rhomboid family intramembrane serine protease [Marvinbryantia formatexigens]UWO26658.1 rhomboid family intramembrane serine protease [Marvinbryantia formatexigens DSM 14469]SDG45375.1 rhomboid protease GluP [Marvinbryantia formatexigens]
MNLLMVLINIAVFLIITIMGGDTLDAEQMLSYGAMYPPYVTQKGEYYRLFTCMFLHFGWQHLFYNMLLLWFAGDMLEERSGPVRYLVIYLAGGVAGNVLSFLTGMERQVVSAGASGAVFAVIGALVWLVVKNRGKVEGIDNRGLCMMAVLSLAQGFMDAGVDHMAHLGGFIGGFLLAAVLRTPSAVRRKDR